MEFQITSANMLCFQTQYNKPFAVFAVFVQSLAQKGPAMWGTEKKKSPWSDTTMLLVL